jgi:hypothetical protein
MFGPKLTDVVPARNPVPVRFTVRVCPLEPDAGEIAVNVGRGFPTRKPFVRVAVPPPGGGFVTVTFRLPSTAPAAIASVAVICVGLAMVVELTVIPEPKSSVVDPVENPVPTTVTVAFSPLAPCAGVRLVIIGTEFSTLKTNERVAFPPPGAAFTTLTLLAAVIVFGSMVIEAVSDVALATVTELTTMPSPKSADVTPVMKLVPLIVTLIVCPFAPELGVTPDIVGTGFPTVNAPASIAAPPPGAAFATLTLLAPTAADMDIVTLAVRRVPLVSIETEFTVIPVPKSAVVVPAKKSVPVTTMFNVWPSVAVVGVIDTIDGMGFCTVNPPVSVVDPPPGAGFDTTTSRAPSAAERAIASVTVIWVGLVTVTAEAVAPAPAFTVVAPAMKSAPVICTVTDFPRAPTAGEMAVMPGAGLLTVNPLESVAVPPPGPAFVAETFLAPVTAESDIVARARICVGLITVTESNTMPVPKSSDVVPL